MFRRLASSAWSLPGPLIGALLLAAAAHAEQLPLRAYGIQDGLASDSVTHILRDYNDYLWFATTDGVSRFDGEHFTSYAGEDGLPQARVERIVETRDGTIWLATRGGLSRFIAGRPVGRPAFASIPWGGAAQAPVFALYEDRAGRLWVGGEGRVAVLASGGQGLAAREVSLAGLRLPAGRIGGFAETADGSLWIGTEGGLLRRTPDGRSVAYPVRPQNGSDAVVDLAADSAGRLWIAHALGAFVLRPEQAPGDVRALTASGEGACSRIYPAADGRVWLAGSRGLAVWDAERGLTVWGIENGLPEPAITAVAEDRAGNLWMGTGGSGALRLSRRGLAGFTARDGLAGAPVQSLFSGADGALYVQSAGSLPGAPVLQRFDGSRFVGLRPRLPAGVTGLEGSERQTAVLSRTGEWWLATGQGLLRYPAVPFAALARTPPVLFTSRDGLGGTSIERLFEDSRGDVWIATLGPRRLTRWRRASGTFQPYGPAEGLTGAPVAFAEDRHGAVWVGFAGGGVARLGGDRFAAFGATEGVPSGRVHDLFADRAGRLWVATEDGGVGRLDAPDAAHPRFTTLAPRDGLASGDVRCITEDAWGRLYFGGRKGIDRLDPATGRIERFTTADGLLDNVVDSAFRDRGGDLWFGTRRGLSRLVPALDPPAAPPPAWITAVRVDGAQRLVSELGAPSVSGPDLEAQSRLEVEFLALDFAPGAALRYQHKMEGVDAGWSQPAEARVVQYAELPEGWLRFLVRAVTREGAAGSPAVVVFHVEPPLWRRGWVVALAALGATLAGFGFYWYRLTHLVAIERMRTRIATDLHDDLGSSLTRVSILSEVARRRVAQDGESSRLVSEIGVAAREMMEALGESIWAIDPRRDDLRSFVTRVRRFAGDLLDGRGIAWHLRAPQESELVKLSPVQRRQLFLLVKEALHNVARHSGAAAAEITIAVSGRRMTVEIHDDGRGFDPEAMSPEAGNHGMRSMRERAKALGAQLVIDSVPGQGTRLFLDARLPGVGRA